MICDLDGDGQALAGGDLPGKKNCYFFGDFFILKAVFADTFFAVWALPSVALGKVFTECIVDKAPVSSSVPYYMNEEAIVPMSEDPCLLGTDPDIERW
jgi:hypothetical protein